MNSVIYSLADNLLREQLDANSVLIANVLLNNGSSTIYEVIEESKLSFNDVKNSLVVLLQHKLISFVDVKDTTGAVQKTVYSINLQQILFRLKLPIVLSLVDNLFGPNGVAIVQTFASLGVLSAFDCIDQVIARSENKIAEGLLEKILISLIKKGFLIETSEVKVEKVKGNSKNSFDPLIYDKTADKPRKLFLNSVRIEKELLNQQIIGYVSQKVNMQAGLVASFLLNLNNSSKIEKISFTLDELISSVEESGQKFKKETLISNVELMNADEFKFIEKGTLNGEGEQIYIFNAPLIGQDLKSCLVERQVEEQLSNQHLRIFRFLNRCGPLDMKNVL